MTWYANEILAAATDGVLRAVSNDHYLLPFAYRLREPFEHDWHAEEVVHRLPPNGLVVVRPVCDANPELSPADWYDEPILDWNSFATVTPAHISIAPDKVADQSGLPLEALPPINMVAYLQRISELAQTTIVYYQCSMWGGSVESEYAWLFGCEQTVLVTEVDDALVEGRASTIALQADTVPRRIAGDLLTLSLASIGLKLPTPFFAPFTRSFDWQRYRLLKGPPNLALGG